MNAAEQFRDAIASAGLTLPAEVIGDGKIHRFSSDGRPKDDAGWYIFHDDDRPAGRFGCHRRGIDIKWSARSEREFTPAERDAWRARMDAARAQRDADQQAEREACAATAADMWDRAQPGDHPYAQRKLIDTEGARVLGAELLIPVLHSKNNMVGLQRIWPDCTKTFLKGTPAHSAYTVLGKPARSGPVVICEGWATGKSILAATGLCVVVAFTSGNLLLVAEKIRRAMPDAAIIIAADDDYKTEGNPGMTNARKAGAAIKAAVAIPVWSGERGPKDTDFNDLHAAEGLDAVRRCFDDQQQQATTPVDNVMEILLNVSDKCAPEYSDDDLSLRHLERMKMSTLWCETWGRWLVWSGDRWIKDETNVVFDAVRQSCRLTANDVLASHEIDSAKRQRQADKIASYRTISNVERLARTDRTVATHPDEWDCDKWMLNTPGGVVDLRDGSIRPHRRDDRFTKITAVAPAGDCSTWIRFLHTAANGDAELIGFLKRMCGYALTGEIREHALFFVYGTGGNGKGTFLNAITHIMGDYQRVSGSETFTESICDRHTTELARLQGARLVTAQETEEGKRWAESRIKALTGGDPITARYMRQDDFTFLPQFKLVIVGNHKPSFRNVDEAIRRRLHLVPFTAVIPASEKDPMLADKLKAEAAGILAWMIEGCLEWNRDGLKPPSIVKDSTDVYLGSEDSLKQWMDECCDVGVGFASSKSLFASWAGWCEESGEFVGSMKRLMAKLESRGILTGQKYQGQRGCTGIKIKPGDGD